MSLSNITATATNGVQVISSAQVVGASVTASAVDETLAITVARGITCNNNSGAVVSLTNCNIQIGSISDAISTQSQNEKTGTNSRVYLDGCRVQWNLTNARCDLKVTRLAGTVIRATKSSSSGLAFLYTQAGSLADIKAYNGSKTVFDGIHVHEITGAPLTFQDAIYQNCGINILNWEAGDLSIRGVTFGSGSLSGTSYTGPDGASYSTYDAWVGNGNTGNRLRFFDCSINLSKIAINLNSTAGTEICFKYFSRSEKYFVGSTPVAGLTIQYTPTASTGSSAQAEFWTSTDANGLTTPQKVDLLTQNTVHTTVQRNTGLSDPSTVFTQALKNVSWRRTVRGYGLQSLDENVTPTAQIGESGKESYVYLLSRTNAPSLSKAAAAALTGITLTAAGSAGGVMTISIPRSVSEIWAFYNNWITLQANRSSTDTWTYDGTTLNIGAWSVINNSTISGGGIKTSTTISGTGSISGTYTTNTGTSTTINVVINVSGARVYVEDSSGVQKHNAIISGKTASIQFPPATSGVWKVRAAIYGYGVESTEIDVTGGGEFSASLLLLPDAAIADSSAGVQAYTVLDHQQKIYDYSNFFATTEAGIVKPPEFSLSNGTLSSSKNILFNGAASSIFAFDGSIYTIKASSISGQNITATGTVTLTNCTQTSPLIINDGTGGTRVITGVAGCYIGVRDVVGNTYTLIRSYAITSGDYLFRTKTGHTYQIDADAVGRVPYTTTISASSGTTVIDLGYDRQLIPYGSSVTTADLRTQADSLSGYTFDAGEITFPAGGTLSNGYLVARRVDEQRMVKSAPSYNGVVMTTTGNASMSSGTLSGSGRLVVTGSWSGDVGTVGIEDSAGVRVKIVKSDGGAFNISALYNASGPGPGLSYIFGQYYLPFYENHTSVTYTVPKGKTLQVMMWALGCVTYGSNISTEDGGSTFTAQMTVNPDIDTSIDVSSYLTDIALDLQVGTGPTPMFYITIDRPMTLDGIEIGKTLVHHLAGREVSLMSGFPVGSQSVISINKDEITINKSWVTLIVGDNVAVTDDVKLNFYINVDQAVYATPNYVLAPRRQDGNFVQVLAVKPVLDASQLAAAVWSASSRTLTSSTATTSARPVIEI